MPDVARPGLDVLFCGINPGRWSAAVGHHFAHPGNRFWQALALAGFTDRVLDPSEEQALCDRGLGITNLVGRPSATAAELGADELARGGEALVRKVTLLGPRAVAFLGLGAYRTAFRRPRARPGRQPEALAGALVWLVPNPSGLQAHYPLDAVVAELRALRAAVAQDAPAPRVRGRAAP